jgi:putative SOS response-associated peptidase YedK
MPAILKKENEKVWLDSKLNETDIKEPLNLSLKN